MKVCFWLYSGIVIGLFAQVRAQAADAKEAEKALYARLQNNGYIGGPQVGYEIWVQEVTAQRLVQPVFIRLNDRGGNKVVIRAKEAEVRIDTQKSRLVIRMREGAATSRDGTRAWFEDRYFTVPLPAPKERK